MFCCPLLPSDIVLFLCMDVVGLCLNLTYLLILVPAAQLFPSCPTTSHYYVPNELASAVYVTQILCTRHSPVFLYRKPLFHRHVAGSRHSLTHSSPPPLSPRIVFKIQWCSAHLSVCWSGAKLLLSERLCGLQHPLLQLHQLWCQWLPILWPESPCHMRTLLDYDVD